MGKIAIALSGGVDSSVAALVLQEQGEDLLGIFMKNWEDETPNPAYRTTTTPGCRWEEDFADVRAVCARLNIPYLTFDFVEAYRERVFQNFLSELHAGFTPNPDILCNQEIKFQLFLEKALKLPGVHAIATGHYARIVHNELRRPRDRAKDQTYFLYRMPRAALSHVRFPLADMRKSEVRARARKAKFPNAEKKDSTGICFIGNIDYRTFIREHIPDRPGPIVTTNGRFLGNHPGLHLYTIGQRHGINVGGRGPYYVVLKQKETNTLMVTNDPNDPQLFQASCRLENLHWLVDAVSPEELHHCEVQIRYRQEQQPANVTIAEDGAAATVIFQRPARAVTLGQSAVIYRNDRVLGGGIIRATA